MSRRLSPREGEWIDRDRPIEFQFEGTSYRGYAGDTVSSALWANDVWLLGRSFKYHRPRGIYSLAGHDANVMVENGQRTNLRGDCLPIEPGLYLHAVNTVGGLERDRLSITEAFSKLLPVGFYYKAFHTPRRLFPFYENQMRQVAGLGKINPASQCVPSPKDYAFCDLLVVGAGPAGLAAAIAAAEQGVNVLLVDEQVQPGGSLGWQWVSDPIAQQQLRELLGQVHSLHNLELRCATQAGGWYADHWVALFDNKRLTKLRAKSMIAATGSFEQPAVFQNNDLPGVMLGSAAQRLIHCFAVKPFDRAVVLAAHDDAYRVALDLHDVGVDVVAVVDLRMEGGEPVLSQRVADAKIVVYQGHTVYEAVPGAGKKCIRGAMICPLDGAGNPRQEAQTLIDCDGIVVSIGWAPNNGLVYQAGGRFRYAEDIEQFVPAKLPSDVFVAGRANGVFELNTQFIDGRRAGLAAAAGLGRFSGEIPSVPKYSLTPSHPYPIFVHKGKKNFVDFDEDVHLDDLVNAHQEGYDNIELLKRYTTVGMGPSQGKLSNTSAMRILARLNGASIEETGTTTSRPFHQPVPLGQLAGRRFHPQRRTPMNRWHTQFGAEMVHAGAWLRPEYYKADGKSRDDCILDEALAVRNNVGLIDVGTLGKIYVNGPDAARFLELIYTGRFAKQRSGSIRYGLACDESGIIVEDGVVARLADDRFYVSAPSTGADAFYREMQRWALIFTMDVVLVNATGQLTAMNIAGPKSRDILQDLTKVDLSPEAFPYLGVREGIVAGAPALLMRVGFVGELGYEVHVPSSFGLHVWTAIMRAGERHGMRPFGVEAQRLLRLEKGHFIVGQDTDGLTNPFEADVAWAIGKDKSFFIGSRSLEIARQKAITRQLVGLAFATVHSGSLPEECHLIFDEGNITGRITSIGKRSSLGRPIALAFVQPHKAKVGTKVQIRVDDGTSVGAEVVKLPFYDPENTRQQYNK